MTFYDITFQELPLGPAQSARQTLQTWRPISKCASASPAIVTAANVTEDTAAR